MTELDHLALRRAAAEAPGTLAVTGDMGSLTYPQLLERASQQAPAVEAPAVVGHTDLDTVVAIHAALLAEQPLRMVHPRWTDGETESYLRRIGSAGIDRSTLAVLPTSGSSGSPKGVVLSRRAFQASANASADRLGWHDEDRWLLSLSPAHVGGLSILSRCLLARRTVVLPPSGQFEAQAMADTIDRYRVTLLSLVPTMLGRLLALEGWKLPRQVRSILLGGAAASPQLLASAAGRHWPVVTTYGSTETCSQVATQVPGTVDAVRTGCGPLLLGVEARTTGGVLALRGPMLFDRYLPSENTEPFDDEGWYVTGDRARFDVDGNLHILGRADDVIISGGENVDPVEIERVLVEHPAVAEAVVFGTPDERWGEVVTAAMVPAAMVPAVEAFRRPSDDELERFARQHLASHKCPKCWRWIDRLPIGANGKVDRRQLSVRAR